MRPLDLTEKRGKKVTIYFEGKELEAYEGEKLPVALLANEIYWLTTSREKEGSVYLWSGANDS